MKFPDWGMYELEDNVWDEFGESGDHIVPRRGGGYLKNCAALSDTHVKALESENVVEQSADGDRIVADFWQRKKAAFNSHREVASPFILDRAWSQAPKNVVQASHEPQYKANTADLVSEDVMIRNYPGEHKGCDFPIDDALLVANPNFVAREFKGKEIDLMDYDWPDIGNFDDIDKIFSNCESTFGQGSTSTADELAWVSSSSHAIYGSEDTFESGLQSSCSVNVLNGALGHHGANTDTFPQSGLPAARSEKPSSLGYERFADWMDGKTEDKEAYDREDVSRTSTLSQLSTEHSCLHEFGEAAKENMLDSQYPSSQKMESQIPESTWSSSFHGCSSSEKIGNQSSDFDRGNSFHVPGRKQHLADQKRLASAVSAAQAYPKQRKLRDSGPSGCTPKPHEQLKSGLPTHQVPSWKQHTGRSISHFPMSSMTGPEGKAQKLHFKQQFSDTSIAGHPHQLDAFTDMMDPSAVQDSSCMTSVFSDDEATSFQQLQDVMDQLDVQMKLCIRDSLYRLAQSAEQRHGFVNFIGNDLSGNLRACGSQLCTQSSYAELMDAETNTNPIDRSIAHLLFHRPPATGSADDAKTFKSPMTTNDPIHVPFSSRGALPDGNVRQTALRDCNDIKGRA